LLSLFKFKKLCHIMFISYVVRRTGVITLEAPVI
jgi:hypothetical protein